MKPTLAVLRKSELLSLLEFAHEALACETAIGFAALLNKLSGCLPTSATLAAYIHHADDVQHTRFDLINQGFPQAWIDEYIIGGFANCAPVNSTSIDTRSARTTSIWSNTPKRGAAAVEHQFINRTHAYGLQEEVTVTLRNSADHSISLVGIASNALASYKPELAAFEFVFPFLHDALARTFKSKEEVPANAVCLTEREKDVLSWAMVGKTNPEIADLLNISERTVKFHVQNAMEKLSATTRAHAVANALRQGLIAA